MVKEAGGDRRDAPSATITVVLNWVEELKAKLPVEGGMGGFDRLPLK